MKEEINNSYKKNKHVKDPDSIKELTNLAYDVATEIRTTIVEVEKVGPNRYSK